MERLWPKVVFALLIAASSADAFSTSTRAWLNRGLHRALPCGCAIRCSARFHSSNRASANERRSFLFAAAILILLAITCLVVYPYADAGRLGVGGSDADDALIIGAQALLRRSYPFYPTTYLGNPIVPMPGAIILAIPFAVNRLSPYRIYFGSGSFFV